VTSQAPFSVSVVIPLFNKEKSVRRTIGSVLNQSRPPDEIIVVDDGSTDQSAIAAREALKREGSIRWELISQQNAGVSAARNAGAAATNSRFIAFLDADDEWLPDYLAEVERLACAFPDASVITTGKAIRYPDGSIARQPTALPDGFFGIVDRFLVRYRKSRGLIHSSAVTVRRDAWERSGGFPIGATQGEDIYLWLRLGLREKVAHSGGPLSVFHLEHSESEARKEMVGYHFSYFLGTAEGRQQLADRDLRHFLSSHLTRRIIMRRLAGHVEIQPELRRLAQSLPIGSRILCWAASTIPVWTLRLAQIFRHAPPRAPTPL